MNLFPQTGQDCILFSPNTHIPLLFLSFFLMQCYFLFQTESELEWFQEGSRLCKLHLLWEKCGGWRTRGMQRNWASVYAKKNTKSMDENGVKGKKKHTVEENPNCQTGVASAGRPGHNRGCSNLWENVLRSEDMSAAPIKTIITESSPSLRAREAERGSPSGGEGKVCPGCKATPAKLVDSQISTKNFIYLSWRSSRLFLMCIYWNSGPWTHSEPHRIWLRPFEALNSVLQSSHRSFLESGALDETTEPGRISWLLYRLFSTLNGAIIYKMHITLYWRRLERSDWDHKVIRETVYWGNTSREKSFSHRLPFNQTFPCWTLDIMQVWGTSTLTPQLCPHLTETERG